jgi:hypothetical protein
MDLFTKEFSMMALSLANHEIGSSPLTLPLSPKLGERAG